MNMENHITENPLEGFDICYECGAVQEYGTMQDINEVDFDIFCDDCFKKKGAIMNTYELKFVFNSKKANKYEALAEWYRKANASKDFDFIYIEKQRKEKNDN